MIIVNEMRSKRFRVALGRSGCRKDLVEFFRDAVVEDLESLIRENNALNMALEMRPVLRGQPLPPVPPSGTHYTPEEVQTKQFPTATKLLGGYNKDDVEVFFHLAGVELREQLDKNTRLRAQFASLLTDSSLPSKELSFPDVRLVGAVSIRVGRECG